MDEYVNQTTNAFKGLIDKPPMEPKHLQRPPFLFIVKVFEEVMNKTGFGKGLCTEEEFNKDFYSTPQLKVLFLKKINALVKAVEGPNDLVPENVVKGTECEKTNVFLQKLASAARKGKNTDDIVAKILDKINNKGGQAAAPAERTPNATPSQPSSQGLQRAGSNAAQPAKPERAGHKRDVDEMANQANMGGDKPETEDPGKIRMGVVARGNARQNTNTQGARATEAANQGSADGQTITTIEGMKDSIQNITQSINPMGKIIQFIDDDVESMKREYDSWARMYLASQEQLEDKEKLIEAELQPYKDKIVGKEEQIREKKGQIDSLKSKILRNNLKIKKLLSGIIGAS
jgi:hypothetical protein